MVESSIIEIYNNELVILANTNGNFGYYKIKTTSKVDLDDYVFVLGFLISPNEINVIKIIIIKDSETNFVIFRSLLVLILLV